MPICHNKKFIQIHIPKTGGTSITQWLDIQLETKNFYSTTGNDMYFYYKGIKYSAQHAPASLLKELCHTYFDSYYKFAIVRNPYDRALSEFFWTNRKNESFINLSNSDIRKMFNRQLENVSCKLNDASSPKDDHICPQSWFVFDENKKLLVDELFKLEEIESAICKISEKIQTQNRFRHLNKQKIKSDMDKNLLLTPNIKKKIYSIYKEDFDNFGYDQ